MCRRIKPLSEWRAAVNQMRALQVEHNLPRDVYRQLALWMGTYENINNLRWAKRWNGEAAEAYEVQRSQGSHGYNDVEVVDAKGVVWLVGCNFGR